MHSPPLASIPVLMLAEEIRARSRRRWLIGALALGAVIAGFCIVHFTVMPMGDLWLLISQSVEIYLP